MKAEEIIKIRQLEWAKRIIGKENLNKDYPFYCKEVENNIFCDKDSKGLSDIVEAQIRRGSGNELKDGDTEPAKIKAVFSSSALCVNVLQYFAIGNENNVLDFLKACKLISNKYQGDVISVDFEYENKNIQVPIRFEEKFETGIPYGVPNLDAVIRTKSKTGKKQLFAFESKFTEPYSSPNEINLLRASYYNGKEKWQKIGLESLYDALNFEKLKEKEVIEDGKKVKVKQIFGNNKYLDAAQLIKHILGIKNTLAKDQYSKATLVYLWYDTFGADGTIHRSEIDDFCNFIKYNTKDILVKHITYQEVICNLCKIDGLDRNYLNYLAERYL